MLLQTPSHLLRPQTTAHLAQTMTLLALPVEELRQKIENQLASNPALETVEPRRCPSCQRLLPYSSACPFCNSRPKTAEEPIVYISPRTDFLPVSDKLHEDETPSEEWAAASEDLATHVLHQIAPELAEADRPIAAHILTSLDEDGLLPISLLEIARYHHVPLSHVENVLGKIQRADPVGVGSPTPQAALLVQLEVLKETRTIPESASRAIQEGMDLLSRHAYIELGRLLHIHTIEAEEISSFISKNLNPFPARAYWGDIHQNPAPGQAYPQPDLIISQLSNDPESPMVIEIISPYSGSLRINPLFRKALRQAPAEKLEEWQADLDQGTLLIKCLQQRENTLIRMIQHLVKLQREYLRSGDAHLRPITRAQLAQELEVHESTISRAVAGKAVQLPNNRIVLLKKLFDRSLSVRTALLDIIAEEKDPLSDTQIAELLLERGFEVARRTVAKYRRVEGILPARLRKTALNHRSHNKTAIRGHSDS